MPHYMIWGAEKRPHGFMGGSFLDWTKPPLGVWEGETAEEACRHCMVENGMMTTFFAVEGLAWGIALMDQDVPKALGRQGTPMEREQSRVTALLERAEERQAKIDRLLLEKGGENATPTE
jgi:hypothetical protein